MSEHEGALSGLTVVNIGSGLDSAYAAKLLSDLGARVIVVEPPDGAPLRTRPPVADGAGHGAIWAHLASGAESVVPTDRQDARRLLRSLLAHADVLLTDGTSHWQQDLPTAPHERLITADLSAWGRSGPYAEWRESDIATWAMGGYMYFTGEPDREPLIIPGSQSVNHKRVERRWRQEGLRVPRKAPHRRRLWATGGSCTRRRAERPNHVWSYDCVHERTQDGRPRCLLGFVGTYRTLCMAPEPGFRRILEGVRHLTVAA